MNPGCPVCKQPNNYYYTSSLIVCDYCIKKYGIINSEGEKVNVGIEDGIYYCEYNGRYSNERDFTVNGIECYAVAGGLNINLVLTVPIPVTTTANRRNTTF